MVIGKSWTKLPEIVARHAVLYRHLHCKILESIYKYIYIISTFIAELVMRPNISHMYIGELRLLTIIPNFPCTENPGVLAEKPS